VDEDDLPKIYNLADLLLFPSLYEGFGLPILEAQACGCPVLTSNVTSCPEVAGDGAHIVDPYSVDEIRDGILKIIKDNNYKEQLIKKGFENIKRFSWEKSARKILELID
jgi:glycosyltransferase involved in cell wall biosynthesis